MRVKVTWRETSYYEAEIDGPDEPVLREWMAESGDPDAPIDGELIKDWFESGDQDEWHDSADAQRYEAGPCEDTLLDVVIL